MYTQLENLYEQIKKQKISPENAIKQINELKMQHQLKPPAATAIAPDVLQEKAVHYFKKLLSRVIGLPAHRVEVDVPMEEYGIDSVMVMQLTNQLETVFGSLPKTLFFEYQTIQALIEYFLEVYPEQLEGLLGIEELAATTQNAKNSEVMTEPVKPVINTRRRPRFTNLTTQEKSEGLDIAIIGVSGRYPQAKNLQEFWKNLQAGKDSITEIPKERWDHSLYFDEDKNKSGKTYSKWGGFLDGVDQFDPLFFNISPRDAEMMDPQERLFLECVYQTLEDAGYTRETLAKYKDSGLDGNVGVFVGVMYEEYQLYGAQEQSQGRAITLAGTSSSIANRVSYFCNFHGPSISIDTMCSSSLTSIHLACQSLRQGGCELAIAGGVNISIHPNKYLALGQGKFVSSKGRCESFGQGGDGYVPGEGVGAVLLKPLSQAIADSDQIYGIIKGTAINHGGKTNGYTVPNPNAQSSVIEKAIKEAGVHPRSISYIEAHGTGTFLGDPIEVAGLKKVFQEYTQDKQFCAIGSAKSNIGHCESAAGIAGVTKVLLQLKYRQLVPSLHSEILNSNIDFSDSPFVVQQELTEWKRPLSEINGEAREYPRIAGISSFGAGGSNAHIVIEEYINNNQQTSPIVISSHNPAIIILSAKNEERLKEQAEQLLDAIHEQPISEENLADVAYTLQVGREAMEERVAIMAGSIKELEIKLKSFVAGEDGIEDLYRGQVKRNKDTMAIFAADNEMQEIIEKWIQRRKFGKLLDLWVKGLIFDWNRLYTDIKPCRISLPTYPFAKERYWVPKDDTKVNNQITAAASFIHPLLQYNTSNLSEQRFSSTFTGQEFFLADHVVKGQRVLPGVAYLEMARAAVEQATGVLVKDKVKIGLKNIVWVRPVSVLGQPQQVHIGLYPEENGEIAYEIYSESENVDVEPVVHSQGSAVLGSVIDVPALDLKDLQTKCSHSTFTSSQCYEAFRAMGFAYGSGHQGIEVVYTGQGQVLAKLCLPDSVGNTHNQFVLHPSIMDAALQAIIGFMLVSKDAGGKASLKPALPFALQELQIIGDCPSSMWALLRYSAGSRSGDKVQKLDIDLCDEQGNVCVQMKGFSLRALEGEATSVGVKATTGLLMLEPSWKEQAVISETIAPAYVQQVVMLCDLREDYQASIETSINGVRCFNLQSEQENIEERFKTYAIQAFEKVKGILKDKPKGNVLIQIVIPEQGERQLFSGLSGLLKTAQLENSKIIGQIIEVKAEALSQEIIEILLENSQSPGDNHIRYQGNKRWICGWSQVEVSEEIRPLWKDHGIYLITGGAGGLGLIFAKEIAQKAKDGTLILTGRSVLTEDKRAKLKQLEILGVRIEYLAVDVSKRQAVEDLILGIQERYGHLNGIIHSAGVVRDNFIIKKTKDEFQEVLNSKVAGVVNLDEASKNLSLDFFILFSSIAGSLGNVGQADYSTANAFMDGYASYRNDMVVSKMRYGQTLSINWPLWREGGMHVDGETEKNMQGMGMVPLQTSTGIQALYQGVAYGNNQIMVIEGNIVQIKEKVLSMINLANTQVEKASISSCSSSVNASNLLEKVQSALVQIVSTILKVNIKDIDVDTELNEYGFDSITLTQFSNKLNQKYKIELNPTIFFEYPTIHSFAEYLNEEYQEVFTSQFGVQTIVENLLPTLENKMEEVPSIKRGHSRFVKTVNTSVTKPDTSIYEPIAIVGVSGIFPGAKDMDEFWENLVQGKDCITEIPKERWNWKEYYGNPTQKTNKTNIKWGGFIEGIDQFDPLFFGISPKEAEFMDPQQRLLMTYIWKAIEDAGYSAQSLSGTQTAIFVGTGNSGYDGLLSKANIAIESYSSTGLLPSVGPNRMSYFLNIHGPSEPVETACSSSLVAIHRAVSAIENGNCQMAIAGGINIIITPDNHIKFNKTGMLCEDGKCKTFSDQANGYVRGEGVGMIVLKKLRAAEQAGDHIYGVIRGTAVNHGGRANSLTAPNPKAQAELLQTAYTKAGIDPRTVSYIEAHGTGTELGDPIEINGLKTAFRELYKVTGNPQVSSKHCGLGSVKTNIGHLELAAGIAGVIKILLQIKNKTLTKSLHCQTLNPYIQLKDSPFYIVQENEEWKPLHDLQDKELPRRAGVSAFGFGGVNAHIVIEEYIPKNDRQPLRIITNQKPVIIVLSAKNGERLKEQAQQLLDVIKKHQFSDENLVDIAYTLQVGREAMEERLAIVVKSINELEEKLKGFMKGQGGIEDLYCGQVKRNNNTVAVFTADEDMAKTIEAWIAKEKYTKVLELWIKGLIFDWHKLYGDSKPCRISLPSYPFARERYWVPETSSMAGAKITSVAHNTVIHPLLHQNTSDLSEQRFSSTFTGQELFWADHSMNGQRVLPGVTYLEMARAAIEQAAGYLKDGQNMVRLKNVVWASPTVIADRSLQIHISLYPEVNNWIAYEIYSQPEGINTERVVHNQGSAVLSLAAENPILDLKALQAECNQSILTSNQCYETGAMGSEYGLGYQGIEVIYIGSNQVLAKLSLPFAISDNQSCFVLHPSIMHSALQASIVFNKNFHKSVLPFALQELEIVSSCTSNMWALLRYSVDSGIDDKRQKFDIDVCDEQGKVCIRMKGLSLQEFGWKSALVETTASTNSQILETSQKEQAVNIGMLREKTLYQLKMLLAELTKLEINQITLDEPLESYGIDSIMITQLNQKFADIFGEVSKTLLYEYQTLGGVLEYFISDYQQECIKWTGLMEQVQVIQTKSSEVVKFNNQYLVLPSLKEGKHLVRSLTVLPSGSNKSQEPIAIVGMSGRYPQAKSLTEYWANLESGKDCITEIPEERWSLEDFYCSNQQEAVVQGKSYSKWGGFVEGFADFDPLFFNISPREALTMDPQERLFIESCWEVFEDAGYTKEELAAKYDGEIGVFAGITKTGFDLYGPDLWKHGEAFFPHTSFSSVANRISYLLNLHGPSMAFDTMCSSSLTAIHNACECLQREECEMAIAGGVNLYLHPSSYNGLCAQQMLSPDGKCKSFGQGSNGFVPGEGTGTILLKRLSKAIADGDHIYAVIRGTSINHGGKTNGYTVPNPTAQGDVIRKALDKSGVNARTISYIEAHGTGTELGDPIEITGLTQAFCKETQDTGYCTIGSVKSNIGHLEAAAGIAGVTKIVLQMQHKKLVPSLHAKELNPNINFTKSPFVVQQELSEWKRPVIEFNGEMIEYPRIAGISAFGAGGSNAHVVIEEYIDNSQQSSLIVTKQNPAIIVLSAKNEARLKEQVQQLLVAICEQRITDENLADVAYTLQVGREAMEERIAMLAVSSKDLEEKLKSFLEGQGGIEDLYYGQVKRNKETLAVFAADEDMVIMIEAWMNKGKYTKILDLWVKGLIIDWRKIYGDIKSRRISLPTYPFAKERYWVPEMEKMFNSKITSKEMTTLIHPLLHQNTSDFSEQRFSSTFTGQEFFLADHIVKGQSVLPGVAYLEMARAAVEQAVGAKTGIQLKNVIWARPITALGQPVQVHIGLYPEDNGEIAYEIYSETDSVEPTIHSQGNAILSSIAGVPAFDIKALQADCIQGTFTSSQCYEAFKIMGIEYGSGQQGIEILYAGKGQVLAKLRLPTSVLDTKNQYILHPSLMDAALQATIGFMLVSRDMDSKASLKPVLPFALRKLEIINHCPSSMWALLRYSAGSRAEDRVQKFDIDLCDEQGNICVRIKEFSLRVLEGEVGSVGVIEMSNPIELDELDNEFCQNLLEQISTGKLSEEEFQSLTMMRRGGIKNE